MYRGESHYGCKKQQTAKTYGGHRRTRPRGTPAPTNANGGGGLSQPPPRLLFRGDNQDAPRGENVARPRAGAHTPITRGDCIRAGKHRGELVGGHEHAGVARKRRDGGAGVGDDSSNVFHLVPPEGRGARVSRPVGDSVSDGAPRVNPPSFCVLGLDTPARYLLLFSPYHIRPV